MLLHAGPSLQPPDDEPDCLWCESGVSPAFGAPCEDCEDRLHADDEGDE